MSERETVLSKNSVRELSDWLVETSSEATKSDFSDERRFWLSVVGSIFLKSLFPLSSHGQENMAQLEAMRRMQELVRMTEYPPKHEFPFEAAFDYVKNGGEELKILFKKQT